MDRAETLSRREAFAVTSRPLNPQSRTDSLEALRSTSAEDPLDVLVVGGGVVGAAAAFDAATRGLSVGLVEARDLAQGTSSRSSKLVHGGLRYLQMLDFKLVAEALRERDLLLQRTAPHLVHSLPFVFPFEKRVVARAFIGSGVSLYDVMSYRPGGKRPLPFHRHLSRSALREEFPGLDQEKFIGALEYFDAQVDDARLVLTLARSAHQHGAYIATRAEVTDYLRQGSEDAVVGVRVKDLETQEEMTVYARETVLAAGVWTGEQQRSAEIGSGLKVLASKGIHITVPRERIPAREHVGVITQTEKSVLFIIPMGECWGIGTTDTAWHEPVDVPAPTSGDIDYVLEHANSVLQTDLTRDDVIGTWAGLRPLLQPDAADESKSTKVAREHTVMRLAPGLTTVAGGKLTTYRVMAEDAVTFAIGEDRRHRDSLTSSVPLLGGQGYGEWAGRAQRIAEEYGWDRDRVMHLLGRYGSLLGELLQIIDERPDLGHPLEHARTYLRGEIVYAARAEGAMHLGDVLERRTRLFYEVRDRGVESLEEVIDLLSSELGWDEQRRRYEEKAYRSYVDAQLSAEQSATDAEAAHALQSALPVVPSGATP